MRKIKLIVIMLSIFFLTSCSFKSSNLDDALIYTTIYPVEFITNYLYGENSTIESIYPDGVNLEEYELTSKQIEVYADSDLFVYVGLGKEKEIAKSFLNENKDILIIDATYGLNYNEDLLELWLAPNNFLMLAKNIKESLNEYLDNSFKEEEVTKLYDDLYVKVSWIDAELRNIARDAKENDNNTIIVSNNVFKFLNNYGFNVISLEEIENSNSDNAINDIKSKFKNSTYSNILKLNSDVDSELVKELTDKYKAKTHSINDIVTNSDTASDYVSIQYENIAVIRDILSE